MEVIIHTLNQKWALVFALIPGVNLLYLVFRFLTVTDKSYRISIWKIGLVGAPICILYPILPDSLNWLVTHLILSAITVLTMVESRGGYSPKIRFPITIHTIAFVFAIAILLIVTISVLPISHAGNVASRNADKALEAIIYEDEVLWHEVIHPEYGTDIWELDQILRELKNDNIVLTEDYKYGYSTTIGAAHFEGAIEAADIEKYIYVGDKTYRLVAVYVISDNGSGFASFEIIKNSYNGYYS